MNLLHFFKGFLHGIRWSAVMMSAFLSSNREEKRVRPYDLPPTMINHSGREVGTIDAWRARRQEISALFSEHVYGVIPDNEPALPSRVESESPFLHDALKKEITLFLTKDTNGPRAHLLLITPQGEGPHPVILGYNLEGNHTIHSSPAILKHLVWSKRIPGYSFISSDTTRGRRAERWPVEKILSRGYALATLYYGDIEPDYPNAVSGIRAAYPNLQNREDNFSAVGAWAWGLSRVMDYFEAEKTHHSIDVRHVALFGFSRAGKAALLTAARDGRFAGAIAASSGKGGASLSRRNFGETLRAMTKKYPHWFSKKFASYAGREDELPIDQHMLLSLIAPRPLLISAAARDWWSDPKGAEAAVNAARADTSALYGKEDTAAFYSHEGKHDVTTKEWEAYLDFLDTNL